MPGYSLDMLVTEVSQQIAKQALDDLSDDALVACIQPAMVANLDLPVIGWNPNEPEHEGLAGILREQLVQDLRTIYFGQHDDWCDDHLAVGMNDNGRTILAVLYDEEADNTDYIDCNPVIRLRATEICRKRPAQVVSEPLATAIRQAPGNSLVQDWYLGVNAYTTNRATTNTTAF